MSDALCYRDLREDNERLREQVKQFKESIAFAAVTIAVLRSQVDDLTKEVARLKATSDDDAEPITEEWLRSISGCVNNKGDYEFAFRLDDWQTFVSAGYSTRGTWWVVIEQDEHEIGSGEECESRDIIAVGDVKTRGQLRKLLEALKGATS